MSCPPKVSSDPARRNILLVSGTLRTHEASSFRYHESGAAATFPQAATVFLTLAGLPTCYWVGSTLHYGLGLELAITGLQL